MTLLDKFRSRETLWCLLTDWATVILLIVSIVWRGGKSLDMTWVLTGVSTVAVMVYHLRSQQAGSVPRWLWYAVIGFIATTVLSFLFSTTQNYGLDEVLRTGSLSLLFLWVIRKVQTTPDSNEFALRILRVLGLTTIGACAIGMIVYLFQPVNRFVGTFFDYRFHTDYWPNAWAEFLLLAWPIVVFMALKDFQFNEKSARSRIEFLVRSIVVGFVIGCLFLSYSRGAILVFIAQLLLWAIIVYRKTKPAFPVQRIIPISVAIIAVALTTFVSANTLRSQVYDVQDVREKVTFSASEGTSSVSERAQFWSQALRLASQKPVLGWGPYSFRFVQPALQRGVLATSDHPHNVLLKLFMERGVIALLFFVFVVGTVLYRSTMNILSPQTEAGSAMLSLKILIFISLIGVVGHNMIDYNLQFVGIAIPFWILLALLLTLLDNTSLPAISQRLSRVVEILVAVLLLAVACYEGGYLVVSSLGRQAEAAGNTEAALEWYNRAEGERFSRDLHLSQSKLYTEQSNYDEAQRAVDIYMVYNAEDYRAWKRWGEISLLSGHKETALTSFQTSYEKGKYNDLGVLRGLLETYQAMDDKNSIEQMKPEIDELLNDYAEAIQQNAHFIALSPNVEELVSVCNTLARLFPDDAPKYQVMAAKADHQAQIERGRIASRAPGFLW